MKKTIINKILYTVGNDLALSGLIAAVYYLPRIIPYNLALILLIIVFIKLLSFYKVYRIFFQRKAYFLQFFLYFCTLEIVPLATLGGVLMLIDKLLKITY